MAAVALDIVLTWISWYGQSSIRIEYPSPAGTKVVWIDPLKIEVAEKADLILITHPHQDHFDRPSIDRLRGPSTQIIAPAEVAAQLPGSRALAPGESAELGWIKVEGVPAYNVKRDFHKKSSKWLGYILELGGRRIWHAGDTERIPEMKDFHADIALVPLGQTYTMSSPEEAAQAVLDSGASIAIPIHYGMYEGSAADALAFKKDLEGRVRVEILQQRR